MDWCRDIDYGSLPQWLALLVGGVVAGFTIYGILTARQAYLDDVSLRKYAQARLVWTDVVCTYLRAGEVAEFTSRSDMRIDGRLDPIRTVGHDQEKWTPEHERDERTLMTGETLVSILAKEELIVWAVEIHNDSDELVSWISVDIQPWGTDRLFRDLLFSSSIRPRSSLVVLVPLPDFAGGGAHRIHERSSDVTVGFMDSAEKMWMRTNQNPVERKNLRYE